VIEKVKEVIRPRNLETRPGAKKEQKSSGE
jgi:hypothetical protein